MQYVTCGFEAFQTNNGHASVTIAAVWPRFRAGRAARRPRGAGAGHHCFWLFARSFRHRAAGRATGAGAPDFAITPPAGGFASSAAEDAFSRRGLIPPLPEAR